MKAFILSSLLIASVSAMAAEQQPYDLDHAKAVLNSLDSIDAGETDQAQNAGAAENVLNGLKSVKVNDADSVNVSLGIFYAHTQRASFRQELRFPPTNPPILLDVMACNWSYVDPLGNTRGDDQTNSFNLNVGTGGGYTLMSGKAECVVAFGCMSTLRVQGTSSTKNIPTTLRLPAGDCLIEAARVIL